MTHASNSLPTPARDLPDLPAPREGLLIRLAEAGAIPDALLRAGMRHLCRERLREEQADDPAARDAHFRERLWQWRRSPVAVATDAANAQHYEVPAAFFEQVLGPHLKYSCALWPDAAASLEQAEAAMLALTCERARLADGQAILELGCGWGSLTLYLAARYPRATVVGVSNSASQREWILRQARARGLANVDVVTADINAFAPARRFDRVVSVEMFEHVRNHEELFRRIRGWLNRDGLAFAHVFCHRELAYPFDSNGPSDWMARHFFSGGVMPSLDLFLHYPHDLQLQERWWISGEHYARTSEAWLENLDRRRDAVLEVFRAGGVPEAERAVQRWRMFFMAVAELFGLDRGRQWGVAHYLWSAAPES